MSAKPVVLFIGSRDAACSQIAAGFLRRLGEDQFDVRTAGTDPAEVVDPLAMEVMTEIDVAIGAELPQPLTDVAVADANVVVVLGAAGEIPYLLGTRYEDWQLERLDGQDVEAYRRVREDLRGRVEALVTSLG